MKTFSGSEKLDNLYENAMIALEKMQEHVGGTKLGRDLKRVEIVLDAVRDGYKIDVRVKSKKRKDRTGG